VNMCRSAFKTTQALQLI